jgi:hypothetical protein
MKKLYLFLILITIGITHMFAQNCSDCYPITKAFRIGTGTGASGQNSFVGGNESFVTGNNAFVFGDHSNVDGLNGIALGSNANVDSANGIAIGNNVRASAANSYVFGMGASSSAFLTNSIPNSLMFGVTHKPSLTILQPPGADRGYLGIGTTEPTEMAHVVGTLLIERTAETASRLQFRHLHNTDKGIPPDDPPLLYAYPYYWDIYSDYKGLKFNTVVNDTINTQNMFISRGGSVGIGIATPLAKLHVDNNILAEGNITTFNKLVLATNHNSTSDRWEISRTDNGLNYAYNSGMLSQNILFVGNDGFVGVGQTNPSATLDVNGLFKAADATITGLLTAKTLNAQNATIEGTLSADELSAGSATIDGTLSANLLSAPNAKISNLLCAKEIRVSRSGLPCWPDYVFNKEYKLPTLNELEQFIAENQHLPNIPSAAEVVENGFELGEMNALLLQKVEELTLYIIQLEKRLSAVENKKGGE